MHDPQYQEFRGRLEKLDRMHSQGYGFEAPGTLGRSRSGRRLPSRLPLWRSLGMIALSIIVVKALILAQIGVIDYTQRLERGAGESIVQQVSIYVMQIDPITEWLASRIRDLVSLFG